MQARRYHPSQVMQTPARGPTARVESSLASRPADKSASAAAEHKLALAARLRPEGSRAPAPGSGITKGRTALRPLGREADQRIVEVDLSPNGAGQALAAGQPSNSSNRTRAQYASSLAVAFQTALISSSAEEVLARLVLETCLCAPLG